MSSVFLNGEFVSRDEARISAFDAAFQHGVGLFETMLAIVDAAAESAARAVRVVHLHEHLARLSGSARQLGLSESIRTPALAEAVERTAAKAAQDYPAAARFRIRLTLTGGDLNMLEVARSGQAASPERPPASPHDPTILIVAQPAGMYPPEMFDRGVGVVIGDLRLNPLDPFAGHKTVNYWPRLRELQVASSKRAGEALLFQVSNYLAGGCVSNVLLVKAGRLLTPIARGEEQEVAGESDVSTTGEAGPSAGAGSLSPGAVLPSPVLPGIVRAWALREAEARGVDVDRRMLSIDDVVDADEVFLTNSSWGVLPVVRVEREAIGDGVVGPVARDLRAAWLKLEADEA